MWRKYNRREALRLQDLKKKLQAKGVCRFYGKQGDYLHGMSVNMPASALESTLCGVSV